MKYNVSWSGGKDSTATIILAHDMGVEIDTIYTVDIMYDKGVSATPFMDDFKKKAIKQFEEWGYKVVRLTPKKTYKELFTHLKTRGKYVGKMNGGMISGMCWMTALKIQSLRNVDTTKPMLVGIAIDEPERLARLDGVTARSLLAELNMTEQQAYSLCRESC